MVGRVTQRAITQTSLQGLYSNLRAVNKLQQQLSSGKAISMPSDDPTGANKALLTRQALSGNAQQARNITDGQNVLGATDSTLQTMVAEVQKVRDLTVQALNGGALDAASLQDIATQVTGIRQSLLAQANTIVQGRPLFGGVTSGNAAYDPSGTYVGVGNGTSQATAVTRRVSDVEAIRVDVTGPEAFGQPGKDLFTVTSRIAADVGNTTQLQGDLAQLDDVIQGMSTALADVGTRSAQMNTAAQSNSSQQLTLSTVQSQTENIDMAKTIMNLQVQQNGYQAALSATAKSISPSLVDYLR
jgi:flagellar hook-associated protein 3 FlgL